MLAPMGQAEPMTVAAAMAVWEAAVSVGNGHDGGGGFVVGCHRDLVSTISESTEASIGCSPPKRRSIFNAVDFATGVLWRRRASTFGSPRKARAAAASSR